jgi:hypothetical protein
MFRGLPVHVLVVHSVVILVPVAAVATLAIAVRPQWRRTYGPLVMLVASGALVGVIAALQSGKWLRGRLNYPDGEFQHGELGEQVIWYVGPFWLLTAAFLLLDRRRAADAKPPMLVTAFAVVAVLVGLASTAQVIRTGESGAESVWRPKLSIAATLR